MPNLLNRTSISRNLRRGLPIGNRLISLSRKTLGIPGDNLSWHTTNSLIGTKLSFRDYRAMQRPWSRKLKMFNLQTALIAQLFTKLLIGGKEVWFQRSATRTSVAQTGLLLPSVPLRVLMVYITVSSRPCQPNSSSIAQALAVDARVVS